jgi:hypothetical protein
VWLRTALLFAIVLWKLCGHVGGKFEVSKKKLKRDRDSFDCIDSLDLNANPFVLFPLRISLLLATRSSCKGKVQDTPWHKPH